jgi:hypothetical protein
MTTILGIRECVDALNAGRIGSTTFRKVLSNGIAASCYGELTTSPGQPGAEFYAYAPETAAVPEAPKFINLGDAKSPLQKYITEVMLCVPSSTMVGQYRLVDILLCYPFIDLDADTSLNNSVTLPRYTDGDGVMPVVFFQAPGYGAGQASIEYVDTDDAPRVSVPVDFVQGVTGTILAPTTLPLGPYFPTQTSGAEGRRKGVKSVTRWNPTIMGGGLGCILLVKPLVDIYVREAGMPTVVNMIAHKCNPVPVSDNARLGFLFYPTTPASGEIITGRIDYLWH